MAKPQSVGNGRFAILPDKARSGGTATIYKAADLYNNARPVAIKLFGGGNLDDAFIIETFHRETEALSTLKHENIVEMISSGYDDSLGQYYVALEWVEQNLSEYLAQLFSEEYGWDTFADALFVPILRGLSFAHSRNVLHRDIKPSNILVKPDGTPTLADFGIAKLVDSLRIGVTVQDFGSRPYAPPERGNLPPSAREDLFSLGLTALHCLITPYQPNFKISHDNLEEAIEEANLPSAAEQFLCKLIALDPEQRPYSGSVALAELERIQTPRSEKERPRLYLTLNRKVNDDLKLLLGCRTDEQVRKAVLKDLSGRTALRTRPSNGTEPIYQLIGEEISYHVKVDYTSQAYLVVLSVSTEIDPSRLERDRENAFSLHAEYLLQPPSSLASARTALENTLYQVSEFHQKQRLEELRIEEKRIYRQWENILQAMVDLQLTRQQAIPYVSVKTEGSKVAFQIDTPIDESLVGQPRRIAHKRLFAGTVIAIEGPYLVMDIHKGNTGQIPARGQLIIDQSASDTAIQRQRKALQQVQYGQCVRPDLGSLLIHPETASAPQVLEEVEPFTPDLDEAKREALNTALYSPDITLVQGPPGTGKTTWIAELVYQFLQRHPGKKVLLAAQTHTALDNALEKIEKLLPKSKLVRLGVAEKISEQMEHHRLEKRVHSWGTEVRTNTRSYLEHWAEKHGISQLYLAASAKLDALNEALLQERDAIRRAKELALYEVDGDDFETDSPTAFVLLEISDRYTAMCNHVQSQIESRLRAAETEKLREWLQRSLTSLENLKQRPQNTTQLPSSETLQNIAYSVFQSTHVIEEALRSSGLLGPSSPLQPAIGTFIEVGVGLASEIESVASVLDRVEKRQEHRRCLRESERAANHARSIQIEIAGLLQRENIAEADIETIEKGVSSLLSSANTDTVKEYHKLSALQQEWLLRFGAGEGFEGAFLSLADVVAGTCVGFAAADRLADLQFDLVIIDEASKATPTETLIAMSRGKRWVLVGDEKQLPPYIDAALEREGHLEKYDLTRQDIQSTLFDRLLELLPPECQTRLSIQHRMIPSIGNLISECFYDGQLKSAREDDPDTLLRRMRLKPITWKSTSALSRRRENQDPLSRSFLNLEEAARISQWLQDLERCARAEKKNLHVGVISGYKAQTDHLDREISPEDRSRWNNLTIEINSVDAFQGREVDLLLYSVTRSNERSEIGFLSSVARLNVALSRGRDGLIIFGDAIHCRTCNRLENPFHAVLKYIEQQPEDCLLEVLE